MCKDLRSLGKCLLDIVMNAEKIRIGVLSLPSVLAAIGLAPDIIPIAGLGILETYIGHLIGQFKILSSRPQHG